jgi:hypothetical protein
MTEDMGDGCRAACGSNHPDYLRTPSIRNSACKSRCRHDVLLVFISKCAGYRVCLCRARYPIAQVGSKFLGPDRMPELRFGNEIHGARLESLKDIPALTLAAAYYDRHWGMLHRPSQNTETIQLRHFQIQEEKIRPSFLDECYRFAAVPSQTDDLQLVRPSEYLR